MEAGSGASGWLRVVPDARQGLGRPAAPAIQARVNWSPLLTPRGTSLRWRFLVKLACLQQCSPGCHGAAPRPILTRLVVAGSSGPITSLARPHESRRRLRPLATDHAFVCFCPFKLGPSFRLLISWPSALPRHEWRTPWLPDTHTNDGRRLPSQEGWQVHYIAQPDYCNTSTLSFSSSLCFSTPIYSTSVAFWTAPHPAGLH